MSGHATPPWFKMPPRVNAADYLAFVTTLLARADPVKVAKQKALEERIAVPFRIPPEAPSACTGEPLCGALEP